MSELSQQEIEVRLATWFAERHMPEILPLQSLSDFVGDPRLNSKSPDVVATIAERTVGIELTAYRDDDFKDSWGAVMPMIRDAVRRRDADFPSLRGLLIGYMPNLNGLAPRKKDVEEFAKQLLDAVAATMRVAPSFTGSCQSISVQGPFDKWKLLKNHVYSVHVTVPAQFLDMRVDASTGFAMTYGTSVDVVAQIIAKKSLGFGKSYKSGIEEH